MLGRLVEQIVCEPAAPSTLERNSDRSQYRYVGSNLLADHGGGLRRGGNH